MSVAILGTGYITRSSLSYPFLSHLTGHPLKMTVDLTGTQLEALKILLAETKRPGLFMPIRHWFIRTWYDRCKKIVRGLSYGSKTETTEGSHCWRWRLINRRTWRVWR